MLNIRQSAPSKGPKRYRRRMKAFVPGQNVLMLQGVQTRVRSLVVGLKEKGWKFEFKVTARSPRGFVYNAEAASMDQAVLQVVGLWKAEIFKVVPKIPSIMADMNKPAAAVPVKLHVMPADLGIMKLPGDNVSAKTYMKSYRELRGMNNPRSTGLVSEGYFRKSKQPGYSTASVRYWRARMRELAQQEKQLAEAA